MPYPWQWSFDIVINTKKCSEEGWTGHHLLCFLFSLHQAYVLYWVGSQVWWIWLNNYVFSSFLEVWIYMYNTSSGCGRCQHVTSVNLQGMDLFFLALSDLVVKQLPSTLLGCTHCILLRITSPHQLWSVRSQEEHALLILLSYHEPYYRSPTLNFSQWSSNGTFHSPCAHILIVIGWIHIYRCCSQSLLFRTEFWHIYFTVDLIWLKNSMKGYSHPLS